MTDRPALPYDWKAVRTALQDNLWPLLDRLGLKNEVGARSDGDGARIFPRNPTRDDRTAGSFVIWIGANARGAWKDYALGDAARGDILDLIAYVARLQAKIDVYWWALDFLGWERRGHADRPRTKAAAAVERERREADRRAADAKAKADGEVKSAQMFKLWLKMAPLAGSPAETYLRDARRIPLDRLRAPPGAIRWAPEIEHVDPETGEVKTWRNVMASAMTRGKKLAALHLTFLKPDGSAKAWSPGKIMWGPARGAAIRLSSGPTGLSPSKAAAAGKAGPLAIGEGIETCLTVAAARPDYRVWAAGALSLMDLFDWPDCASAVVLLGENDGSPAAVAAFRKVEAHWRAQARGRPVAVVTSDVGSDFNDWARGGA